jgi:hypothetical protein
MTPNDAYNAVAGEMSGNRKEDKETLGELEPDLVALAARYAKASHKRWPPRPVGGGWQVTVTTIRR